MCSWLRRVKIPPSLLSVIFNSPFSEVVHIVLLMGKYHIHIVSPSRFLIYYACKQYKHDDHGHVLYKIANMSVLL